MERASLLKLEVKVLNGKNLTAEEGVWIHDFPDDEFYDLIASANRIRKAFKGDSIRLCSIINAKSGLCSEDCTFCAQSVRYETGIDTFPLVSQDAILDVAKGAVENGAGEFSIVTSGRGTKNKKELKTIVDSIQKINHETSLESCASLGILKEETLNSLKDAGLHSYHHNLETARSFFPEICSTHDYEEDVSTVRRAKELGLYVCSGGIFGIGESRAQRVELALTLRELRVDSIPINFLNARPGTPLEKVSYLTPIECLKIIATFRFLLPTREIIICGGREVNVKDLQPLIFAAGANGMMVGNYLTTMGRAPEEDLQMITDLGLKIRGAA
jgi:biotin synthase